MISCRLIANAGVLIETEGIRILLDGLQDAGNYPFSRTPDSILEQMMSQDAGSADFSESCANEYKHIDFLIFTHTHPDHFSAELLAEYLECNHVRRVLCPVEENAQFRPMRQALQKVRVPVWPLKMKHGAAHQYRLTEEICIYSLCVRHMPKIFPKDLCSCLLVQADGKNVLFLADCSYEEEGLLKAYAGVKIDAVFLNPYFYYDERGRHIINEYLQPERIVIYHLPFESDDQIHLRSLARQALKKYPDSRAVLLEEPLQAVNL